MNGAFVTMEQVANRPLNSVGSSRIRARWVAKYWDGVEEYKPGKKYDFLIFQKAWWESMIETYPGIKIMDICDPEWLDGNRPYFNVMGMCDAVTTSTPKLAEYAKKLLPNKPIVCIPDRLDLEEHKIPESQMDGWNAAVAKDVVWFGYSHNFELIEKTLDVLQKYNLRLTVISDHNLKLSPAYNTLKLHNVKYNYDNVHEIIARHDIALLPEPTDYAGQFKSNNKCLTAMALGVPVARTPDELDRLMDPEERKKASEAGLKEVKEKWDVRLSVEEYKKLIDSLCK